MRPGSAAVVVLAGGSGTRVGAGVNKVYLPLAGRHVISWSFLAAGSLPQVGRLVLVVRDEDAELAARVLATDVPDLHVELVVGGGTRHESEDAALAHLAPAVDSGQVEVIAVHDGARPLAGAQLFREVLETAAAVGGAIPALSASGVVREGADHDLRAVDGPDAQRLVRVQTPQAFRARELVAAYAAAHRDRFQGTDTASSVEAYSSLAVRTVRGSATNLKVTFASDLPLAERLIAEQLLVAPPQG